MEYDEKLNLRKRKAVKVKNMRCTWYRVQKDIYEDFWKQGYGRNSRTGIWIWKKQNRDMEVTGTWVSGQDIEGRSVKKCLYYGASG